MNTLMNINPQEDIPENEFFKVYFNEINFEGKIYNLTVAVDKEDNNLYFFPSEVGEILGFEDLKKNLREHYEKDIDYIKLENDKLLKLRELMMSFSKAPFSKFASKINLITESGLYTLISKSRLLSYSKKIKILKLLGISEDKIILQTRMEIEFFDKLEQVLAPLGYTLIKQYKVNNYKIDGYIPELKLAIEYDEAHHKRNKNKDKIREKEIKKELNCNFIRLSYLDTDYYNIGLIIKYILNNY